MVERQLFEIHARKARLEAEQAGHAVVAFAPWTLDGLLDAAWRQGQIDGQVALFEALRDALDKEVDQLREQQVQIEAEIDGITSQLGAQHTQVALVGQDLEAREKLLAQGLIQAAKVLDLQREMARLSGEVGHLTAEIAAARTRVSGLEIEIVKLGERRREAAITRLRDLQYTEIELAERRIRLAESLARLDVRAPVDGVVFGSRILAVQSVVRPADAMMYLVPGGQPLEISARIETIDIDQVHPGQSVLLRFTSFDQRSTPEVMGRVARLSADAVTDAATGDTYYEAVILPDAEALAALDQNLLPGMPVEAFLRTADRTPLQFLIQPLANYFERAFREG